MMAGNRRDRSRSPNRSNSFSRRREKQLDSNDKSLDNMGMSSNMMNQQQQQMLISNMYAQGNMLMGGMYPNMMMSNALMSGGIIPGTGMDLMNAPNMDMIGQAPMDITSIGGAPIASGSAQSMDMTMMGGMIMDPSVMNNMAMYSNSDMTMTNMEEKKEMKFSQCILSPPKPGTADPPRRAKPPGCRTIFIGGLPDNIKEGTVREIFETFGRIMTLRLSTKNFCHIRFDRESCVDDAITLSGYNIKLIGKDGQVEEESKANTGCLHVDFALSRDDQHDFEKRQRQALRAQEAQMRALADVKRSEYKLSVSPPRSLPFSNASIGQLLEKIKSEENFAETLPTLVTWLERGECSKKNSTQFYSMIQATNSHIRRLFNEKMQAEDEFQDCKERVKTQIEKIIEQLEQVAKVFAAASHQRVWDHFTKPQRKNIETWQKMSQEFSSLKEEFNEKFSDDNDMNSSYNMKITDSSSFDEVQQLKLENDSLKFQLEAYKNEIDVIKHDAAKDLEKFKAQFIARQALQGNFDNSVNPPLPKPVNKPPPPPPLPDEKEVKKVTVVETVECGEAKLIGVISAFLQVHPKGASLDYVVSYLRAYFADVNQSSVHRILQKHSDAFQCVTTGVGANIEHRWMFIAFQNTDVK